MSTTEDEEPVRRSWRMVPTNCSAIALGRVVLVRELGPVERVEVFWPPSATRQSELGTHGIDRLLASEVNEFGHEVETIRPNASFATENLIPELHQAMDVNAGGIDDRPLRHGLHDRVGFEAVVERVPGNLDSLWF